MYEPIIHKMVIARAEMELDLGSEYSRGYYNGVQYALEILRAEDIGDEFMEIPIVKQDFNTATIIPDAVKRGVSKQDRKEFRVELEEILNTNCMENGSDTPDFILAKYLSDCLKAFDKAVTRRREWYSNNENK